MSLSYFSTTSKNYKLITTQPFKIIVKSNTSKKTPTLAKKEVELLIKEVNFIRTNVQNSFEYAHQTKLFLIGVIINIILSLSGLGLMMKNGFKNIFLNPNKSNERLKQLNKKNRSIY